MKKTLTLILAIFLVSMTALGQSVRTESAGNFYKHYNAAGVDTILYGTSNIKYVVGIVFGTVVASDSIYIKNGADTLSKMIFTASPPVLPFTVPINTHIDSTFSIVRKKASDVTVIYRISY